MLLAWQPAPPIGWLRGPLRLCPFPRGGSTTEPTVVGVLRPLQVLVVTPPGEAGSPPTVHPPHPLRVTRLGLPLLAVSIGVLVALFLFPAIMGDPSAPWWASMLDLPRHL